MGRKLQPGVDKITEDWVKKQVKDILNKYPQLKYDMPPANMYGNAGRHDFTICQKGLFWTIETKAGKNNKASALQISYADEIRAAGGMPILVNEFNFSLVNEVASYVNFNSTLPYYLSSNFRGKLATRIEDVS